MDKPVITYPCTWSYRVIGMDKSLMIKEISEKLERVQYTLNDGNISTKGNYISINVDAVVRNEEERLALLPLLRSISTVKIVL